MSLNILANVEFPRNRAARRLTTRLHRLARAKRGGMAVMAAVLLPILAGFGALGLDTAYYGYRNLLLRQTVQASGLAATNKLGTYYSSGGSTAAIVAAAQTFATANMPTAKYGTVVTSANVVVGNWNSSTQTFISLASSGGTSPDAVKVTGLNTAANSNAMQTYFGSLFNKTSFDMSTSVVASYASGQSFNTIVINDMSGSFSSALSNQKAIDTAILNCVKGAAGSSSVFGITLVNGSATIYQPLAQAGSNLTALLTQITGLTSLSCLLNCETGSNIASGMYSAIQQFSSSSYHGQSKNIVVITDGVPNAHYGTTYTVAMGNSSPPICTNNCTNDNLWTMAQNQAAAARTAGINVSTIYYSGNTTTADQPAYAAKLASLVGGTGLALVAPTTTQLSNSYAGFCSTIPSSLKTVM